jgi:hypothetical protein
MRIMTRQIPRVRRYVAPLSPQIKLAIINAMLQKNQRRLMSSVPSSQIALTPAQPYQGPNWLILKGYWDPSSQVAAVNADGLDCLVLSFPFLVVSATYLLDIQVSEPYPSDWQWINGVGGSANSPGQGGTLTPQQGHLLYPFIAGPNDLTITLWPSVVDNQYHNFCSAELTQVA